MSADIVSDAGIPAPLSVVAGQEFTIPLSSNPSTGYRWQLAAPLAGQLVQLVGSAYHPPRVARPGAAGQEVWTFKATAAGTVEIAFHYDRSWEKGTPPARSVKIRVIVAAAPG